VISSKKQNQNDDDSFFVLDHLCVSFSPIKLVDEVYGESHNTAA